MEIFNDYNNHRWVLDHHHLQRFVSFTDDLEQAKSEMIKEHRNYVINDILKQEKRQEKIKTILQDEQDNEVVE